MFGLSFGWTLLLLVCLLCVCAFEFINGFHDTANAVATVIYTKSLRPIPAVVLSGVLNGLGVFVGGIAVAMGIIKMLPVETLVDQSVSHALGMVLAILLTAIAWNLGTWYLGIPASSSHTLIGSILGVGIAYSLLPGTGEAAVNWHKAADIGLSLLCSPVFGFILAMLLMQAAAFFLQRQTALFSEPDIDSPPPWWIRLILIGTCSAVSFSHGSNDGQKGIGLMMLILIGIVPAQFAIDPSQDPAQLAVAVERLQRELADDPSPRPGGDAVAAVDDAVARLSRLSDDTQRFSQLPADQRFQVRKQILLLSQGLATLRTNVLPAQAEFAERLTVPARELTGFIDYAPSWVIVLIALSLGLGTMIGWKRIVVTIGEKIGKTHLSYAQGAAAEVVAASTIAASTYLGLPVSTTHVLSSGIAGTMFASGGRDNLQSSTITKILMAWILTLPVCLTMSGTLFLLFRAVLP